MIAFVLPITGYRDLCVDFTTVRLSRPITGKTIASIFVWWSDSSKRQISTAILRQRARSTGRKLYDEDGELTRVTLLSWATRFAVLIVRNENDGQGYGAERIGVR